MTTTMMMMMLGIASSAYLILNNKSPMKLMTILVSMKTLMFMMMFLNSGSSWFSLIMMMIIVGGIMVMMMIMSSLSPNHKFGNLKFAPLLPIIIMMIWESSKNSISFYNSNSIKLMLENWSSLIFVMILMSFYFLCFTLIISKEKVPMRATKCHMKENLVNLKEKWLL